MIATLCRQMLRDNACMAVNSPLPATETCHESPHPLVTRPANESTTTIMITTPPAKSESESPLGSPSCCASLGDNTACCSNPPKSERQIIADAHRERLTHGLRTLASWCASRAACPHFDPETTLTMLEKKAAGLRGKMMKAGWTAIEEHSLHNAEVMHPETKP